MSYRVFARKYRPQTFEEVVGQEHITRTLANAVREDRVAQAYMFVGPRGIGKTSTARILAKALNCVHGPTPEPCGVCDACVEIAEGRCLDVIEIDGASNNGVDNIRDLREGAAYAPARCKFKIYLIDEVHMLSTGAFNALLKTLEEPPPHVKFIFATTEAQKVPPTITSRCQRFDLRRIPAPAIAAHLQRIAEKEGVKLEEEAAAAIARAAEGGLRDAESMLDQAVAFCGASITRDGVMEIFGLTPHEVVSGLVEKVLARDAVGALELIARQAEAGKDLSRLLADVTAHLRDVLVQGVGSDSPARRESLLLLLDHFSETENRMRWAPDKKLQFDVAAIKAVHLLGQATLDDVLENLLAIGANPSSPAPAAQPLKSGVSAAVPSAKPPANPPPPQRATPEPPVADSSSQGSESAALDASQIWEEIRRGYAKTLVKQWLSHGVFGGMQGVKITIRIPAEVGWHANSVVGDHARKEIESAFADRLGRKVEIGFEVDESLASPPSPPEPPSAEPGEEEPASPEDAPPSSAGVPPGDPQKAFLDDPLIQEALEKFQARLKIKK